MWGPLPALLLGASLLLPIADSVPNLNIEQTCRAAASADSTQKVQTGSCLSSERDARASLERRWSEFSAAFKQRCTAEVSIGGSPSYVELLTCIELATGNLRPSGVPADAGTNPAQSGAKPTRP